MSGLHPDFLNLLACPLADCRGALEEADERLVCRSCQKMFPIENDWPVLIPDEASPLEADREG